MTSRTTFGDLATAASCRLEHAADPIGPGGRQAGPVDIAEFTRSLSRFIEVMTRYLDDVMTPTAVIYPERRRVPPWARAGVEAHDALRNAAHALRPVHAVGQADESHADSIRSELDAATQLLTAGRDLLHTHLSAGPDGTRLGRSEWAPVIGSAPITQALMLELGQWVRLAATQGGQLAVSKLPARLRATDVRPELNAACQWLWAANSAILAAQRSDPAPVADTWLLHAIPVNVLPARHRPDGRETVADLCDGATDSAERVRHLVRAAIPEAAWSPEFSADSLREAAACATAISHHNSVLLRTLADSASLHSSPAVGAALIEASTTAADARTAWLSAARAWENITTETSRTIEPSTAEAADLALWTGRLTYADSGWTLAQGPKQPERPPESLAADPADIPAVVAAVHQASETLAQMATDDERRIRLAARARRLHSPTRSLPEWVNNPHPYGRTPSDRVSTLRHAYAEARTASAQATAAVAAIAEAVRAPSRTLTATRAAVRASEASTTRSRARPVAGINHPDMPGHYERTLTKLGIITPDLLLRASAIDHAGDQLVLEATQTAERSNQHAAVRDLDRSPHAGSPAAEPAPQGGVGPARAFSPSARDREAEPEL